MMEVTCGQCFKTKCNLNVLDLSERCPGCFNFYDDILQGCTYQCLSCGKKDHLSYFSLKGLKAAPPRNRTCYCGCGNKLVDFETPPVPPMTGVNQVPVAMIQPPSIPDWGVATEVNLTDPSEMLLKENKELKILGLNRNGKIEWGVFLTDKKTGENVCQGISDSFKGAFDAYNKCADDYEKKNS